MKVDRRGLITGVVGVGAAAVLAANADEAASAIFDRRPTLAMIAYPGMFPLDLVGPLSVFSLMGTHKVEIIWKTKENVRADAGLVLAPSMTFEEAPAEVDILFVPGGGLGTVEAMKDPIVLDFLTSRAEKASYITSVCTGSLILAAAGLLRGYRATSHWAVRERLSELGATPVEERVVVDRNRVSGAGVSAGIDMALTLAQTLAGETIARAIQLNIEYDPHPPFDGGTPQKTGAAITERLSNSYSPIYRALDRVIPEARTRLGISG